MYKDQHIQALKLVSYEETAGKTEYEQFQIPVSHSSTPASGSHSHMPELLMFVLNSGIPVLVQVRILQQSCLQKGRHFLRRRMGLQIWLEGQSDCKNLFLARMKVLFVLQLWEEDWKLWNWRWHKPNMRKYEGK